MKKLKEKGGRTWVYSCEIWKHVSFTTKVKAFQTTWWDAIHSPPWEQQRNGSLQDITVGHKCNGSSWELMNGENPTWCAKKKKKHEQVSGKVKWLGEQKAKHSPMGSHKTSSVHVANQKPCQKWSWKKNGCVIYLKCFLKTDLITFQQTTCNEQHAITSERRSSHTNLKWA